MLYFQNKCQEEINELQVLKSSLQSKLVVEKDKVSSTKAEKEAIEDILNSERSLIASLRNEVTQLKVCIDIIHDCYDLHTYLYIACSYS